MDAAIIEKIKKEISRLSVDALPQEVGRVLAVGDGMVEIEGLPQAKMMEMVVFADDEHLTLEEALNTQADVLYGLILNLEEEALKAVVLGESVRVKEGMRVLRTQRSLSILVSDEMVGRVVDPLGQSTDGGTTIENGTYMPIENEAYGVIDRSGVNKPMHTGIKAIDSMIPIGRGQRELIIGDRQTGKTAIAVDTILNQINEPEHLRPVCIYVAIGQKRSKTANIVARLRESGAMDYTIVVDSSAADASSILFLAPFAGMAIGEYFMQKGQDALVVLDDLSKHANAYRQISLLLRRPPGREAYPGDIFYLHSRLLERSAKLSDELGGGSLTALPVIETQEGDVSAYIPTNVISITDGQIFLDANLFNKGVRPALDIGISVSRVGSAAQTKAMKKVAQKIRLELAQFRELEAFTQFTSDLDDETKTQIESGRKYIALLNQRHNNPVPFHHQVALLYAGR